MKYLLFICLYFLTLIVSADDRQLKICLTGSTEKALPKYGEAFVNGAKLAMSEIGPKLMDKAKLEIFYYESNPLAPIKALDDMRNSFCDAIVGFSTGNDLLAIESNLSKKPILTMSIYGDPQKSFEDTSYLRTMQPSAQDLVHHLFSKLPEKIGKESKVLMITAVDRSEMISYRNAYEEILKNTGSDVTSIEVLEQTHDLKNLEGILLFEKKWDFVILLTRSLVAAEISDRIYSIASNKNTILLGTKYFGSSELPAFFNFLKSKNVTAYFSRQNCSCDTSKEYISFKERYISAYQVNPMSISVDAYDATKFILKSLSLKSYNAKTVIHYLNSKSVKFEGVSSVAIKKGLKLSSKRRFLMVINKSGYSEVK